MDVQIFTPSRVENCCFLITIKDGSNNHFEVKFSKQLISQILKLEETAENLVMFY